MRTIGDYIDVDVLQKYFNLVYHFENVNYPPNHIFNEYENCILRNFSKKTIEMLLINNNPQL